MHCASFWVMITDELCGASYDIMKHAHILESYLSDDSLPLLIPFIMQFERETTEAEHMQADKCGLQFLSALPQLQLLSGQDNELIDLLALTKRETRSKLVFVWANDGKWNDKSKRPFNNCPD
ncbi:hypothetical protein SAY87_011048 [Trapa incisa]|uniref:Uncharacterized protein n=1 Tax=Trapa incisa TaxID=236973 RepID=A0AAN7GIQ7_9MYRT|nr:hypothetical protein SAY87_011048 [Trapa incisa]